MKRKSFCFSFYQIYFFLLGNSSILNLTQHTMRTEQKWNRKKNKNTCFCKIRNLCDLILNFFFFVPHLVLCKIVLKETEKNRSAQSKVLHLDTYFFFKTTELICCSLLFLLSILSFTFRVADR